MYNLNGETTNENTYSSPTGGTNGSYTYNPQNSTDGNYNYNPQGNTNGNYTYNAAPSAPYPMNQMNAQGPKKSGVCGILGLIFSILAFPIGWFIPIAGILLAIAGIVLSIIGCNKQRAARGTGIAGLIISILVLIGLIVVVVIRTVTLLNDINDINTTGKSIFNSIKDDETSDINSDNNSDAIDFDIDKSDANFSISHSYYEEDSTIVDIPVCMLLDEAGVKIAATQIIYETYGDTTYPYINITIQNNSDRAIAVDTSYCSVNGVTMTGYILEEVAPGHTLETDISIDSTEYNRTRYFTSIDSLRCAFDIYDPDSYDTIYEDTEPRTFKLSSSAETFDITDSYDCEEMCSAGGVKLYYIGIIDEYEDNNADFLFYLYNESAPTVYAVLENLYIDETVHPDSSYETVATGDGVFICLSANDGTGMGPFSSATVQVDVCDEDFNRIIEDVVPFTP